MIGGPRDRSFKRNLFFNYLCFYPPPPPQSFLRLSSSPFLLFTFLLLLFARVAGNHVNFRLLILRSVIVVISTPCVRLEHRDRWIRSGIILSVYSFLFFSFLSRFTIRRFRDRVHVFLCRTASRDSDAHPSVFRRFSREKGREEKREKPGNARENGSTDERT